MLPVKAEKAAEPPPVQLHEARRFRVDTEREAFLQHLEEEGYAVVADVLSEQDIGHARSLLWDFLEALPQTRVRRDDVKSWGCKRDWLPDERNGILNGFGFGQSDFMWFLRLRPKVKDAFAAVWSTNDLLVSFDGGNVFRPWRFDPAWRTLGGWYHCDQNTRLGAASRGRCCVQGLVTLSEASRNSGGLVVVPQSHRDHAEVCERSALARGGDFVPISVNDPILEKGPVLVAAKAGDLILWDSRTVHCNTPGWAPEAEGMPFTQCAQMEEWQLLREVGYVCMTPAAWASDETLEQRRKAFEEGISTSHWPHKFAIAGYPLPGMPPNDPQSISQEQRRLIGYDRPRTWPCRVQ
ncbi:unnamed protein product [Durusdinium trenchii]|uniref:Phytanoyl-CoA dioxygenase n=1 Tax=Durusdinium trenchii TaxID=1381693 RepID=A0ABP0QQM9_9DINO